MSALIYVHPESAGRDLAIHSWGEDGTQGTWQRVFQSPLLFESLFPNLPQFPNVPQFPNLSQSPRDLGYRQIIDCDAGGNQNLYVGNFGLGGRILYTPDGTNFLPASVLGLNVFRDLGYRGMVCWKGRLWITPSGTFTANPTSPTIPISVDPDAAFLPVVLVNDDPSNPGSPWQTVLNVASDPLLGDAGNVGIFNMAIFGDALYLGTTNQATGFELWRGDGAGCEVPPGPCELTWQKLIDNGGGRAVPPGETADNARIFAFNEFNGDLYFTSGETGLTKFVLAEMSRIGPDGRWDLIIGQPRDASAMAADPNFNCQLEDSLCIPLSGMGIGFGPTPFTSGFANYGWSLEAHDGVLYAGTLERSDVITVDVEGFDLWRSSDGTNWSLVSNDGFGNPFNGGLRTMASTPLGLFVGTANPDTIEENGGAEVWLGISNPETADENGGAEVPLGIGAQE